jgi:2-oxoisovalerate ferredoxin oxidoreductase beta subunit
VSNSFYGKFERRDGGEGLKGQSTHYCPGCGHGLIHKYLAEAVTELGLQDRAIAISPVGCSVMMYQYMDMGNTQAAHGRTPAVGIGHKTANPDSIVISYQGDGDLASIGLAELLQATQTGLPMTFVFVNNAIYGMTGGQMAPTTLTGQPTATTPTGRTRLAGEPLRVAETIGQLDGPVYVERVALFDSKQRVRAKKAIRKALLVQAENRGLGFVEVLSECALHWKVSPVEAQNWVKEKMLPVFPLGVKKDIEVEPWFDLGKPSYDPKDIAVRIGATSDAKEQFSGKFPSHIDALDVSVKFAGSGGDGAQTVANLTTKTAINEGFDSTNIPCYGPESRGGTSYADVHIAAKEVLSPACAEPHVLIAFNQESLQKFGPTVQKGGTVIYDDAVIADLPVLDDSIRMIGVPYTTIADGLGKRMVKNMVALGALQAATKLFPKESFSAAIEDAVKARPALLQMNMDAFTSGVEACEAAMG